MSTATWQDDTPLNPQRRRLLVAATATLGAIGLAGAAVPFVGSWQPSARARSAGAPVRVNLAKLEPGQQVVAEWRGQPVFVVRRTAEMLDRLRTLDARLADPRSEASDQPSYVDPATRSIQPDVLVAVGLCTHLGCVPGFVPELAGGGLGDDWPGGYFCPCHGSRYDLAGRVFKAQPAPLNLPVPPHRYETDQVVVIGEDTPVAAVPG